MTEAVTVSNVTAIATLVSEIWLAMDRQIDRQADRQTDRQTDRQADRQTGRQTDRQTDRQTNRQTDRDSGSSKLKLFKGRKPKSFL